MSKGTTGTEKVEEGTFWIRILALAANPPDVLGGELDNLFDRIELLPVVVDVLRVVHSVLEDIPDLSMPENPTRNLLRSAKSLTELMETGY